MKERHSNHGCKRSGMTHGQPNKCHFIILSHLRWITPPPSLPPPPPPPPHLKLKRMEAVRLNHLLTGIGRFAYCMHQWGLATSPLCECEHVQTVDHILDYCPIFTPPNSHRGLWELDLSSRSWLANGCPDV